MSRVIILLIGLLLGGCLPQPYDSPLVEVDGERLVGRVDGGTKQTPVMSFKGIPFAAAPVGANRWRAPQPYLPRTGDRPAWDFAPACMQGEHMTRWYADVARDFGADPGGVGRFSGVSEDCLYLNVWTPDLDSSAALPVMVWVHGGSNAGGWSYEPNYLGDRLAARGVVVVTIAYRVGPFGFFSHPKLDNGPGMPVANFGWLDIEAALLWVHRHIATFGGAPDNITLMGESSGAANLLDYIVQDRAAKQGFNRVILQSTPNRFGARDDLQQAMAMGQALIGQLGFDNDSVGAEQLRAIPAEDLLQAVTMLEADHYYEVVTEPASFARTPAEAAATQRMAELDVLIGSNADEWLMYLDEPASESEVDQWLIENAAAGAQAIRRLLGAQTRPRKALDRLHTAREMACPSYLLAERMAAVGGQAWAYHFSRVRPGPGGVKLGAYHGTEIGYVFDQHEYWQSTDEVDQQLTKLVMDYWVQFARTGDPNLPEHPTWPRYDVATPRVLALGDRVAPIAPPDLAFCRWFGESED